MSDFFLFVIILGALIIGHELGHFLAAKLTGVRVEEFGIGFPPRLATLFEAAGTRFTLNLIPLGGFVRPAGEDDPGVPQGLAGSNKRTRAFVLLAGPLANILLAVIAYSAAYKFAAPDLERVKISAVDESSPAADAGLRENDLVLEIEGQNINSFETMQQIIMDNLGNPIHMKLLRDSQELQVEVTPRENPPEGRGAIGVIIGHPTREVGIGESFTLGVRSTWIQFREILKLPGRLIRGDVSPEAARVSGLKGMYDMLVWAGQIDRSSERPFLTLNLIGVISAGLALANLLPIPALDGGRLMFVLFEAVMGRRIDPEYEGLAHTIGFVLLLVLLIYVNLQDFINPIQLPR